ncbi:ankyrin, partial [Glonium stellatum]
MPTLPEDKAAADALWEEKKDTLRELYISENMTLDQVRNVMANSYNFEATNSQYEHWVAVSEMVSKRKRDGKESEVIIDGVPVPPKKVRKEISRNDIKYSLTGYSRAPTPELPEGFLIRTPLTSPSPKIIAQVMATFPSVSRQELSENMLLASCVASNPRVHENTSFQESVHIEYFRTMNLPFLDFVAFYDSQGGLFSQTVGHSVTKSTTSLLSTMHSVMPNTNTEGAFPVIQTFEDPTKNEVTVETIKFMFFVLSNNLLDADPCSSSNRDISSWLRSKGGMQLFKNLMTREGSSFESLAEKLFQIAIKARDVLTVEALLRMGLQLDKQAVQGRYDSLSPLLYACESNNIEMARCLIDAGADVNGVHLTANDQTVPLECAINDKNPELVSLLLKKGAQVNRLHILHLELLAIAVEIGNIEIIRHLLSAGVEVNSRFDGDLAASAGEIRFVQLLLSRGAQITDSTLYFAAESNNEILQLLLDAGANVNGKTKFGNTALTRVIEREDPEQVAILLARGANLDGHSRYGTMTPLQEACYAGNMGIAETLLAAGALVNAPAGEHDKYERQQRMFEGTALQAAAHCGHKELVQLLLDAGANPHEAVPRGGETPLVSAVKWKDAILVALLLDAGVDVNQRPVNSKEKTALHYALEWGNASIIEDLL